MLYRAPILSRPNVKLCKPIQVGFAILDLSKRHMHDGYYKTWLQHFPKSQLFFKDTDSFCVAVEHPDVYGKMTTFKVWFDFSKYPKDHPLSDETNRKLVGKFKDELNGLCMTRFIVCDQNFTPLDIWTCPCSIRKNTAKGVQKAMNKQTNF